MVVYVLFCCCCMCFHTQLMQLLFVLFFFVSSQPNWKKQTQDMSGWPAGSEIQGVMLFCRRIHLAPLSHLAASCLLIIGVLGSCCFLQGAIQSLSVPHCVPVAILSLLPPPRAFPRLHDQRCHAASGEPETAVVRLRDQREK